MKTIEELYNIAEHALDGFEAGCYALCRSNSHQS